MNKIIGNIPGNMNNIPKTPLEEKQQMAELARLIRSADDVKCDRCESLNFINVYRIRRISGLITGTGRDVVVPVPVYACADCGNINDNFLKGSGLDRDVPQTENSDLKSPELPTDENKG